MTDHTHHVHCQPTTPTSTDPKPQPNPCWQISDIHILFSSWSRKFKPPKFCLNWYKLPTHSKLKCPIIWSHSPTKFTLLCRAHNLHLNFPIPATTPNYTLKATLWSNCHDKAFCKYLAFSSSAKIAVFLLELQQKMRSGKDQPFGMKHQARGAKQ